MFGNTALLPATPQGAFYALIDIGPTVLSMFGAAVPDYMDGKALVVGQTSSKAAGKPQESLAEVV